MKKSQVLFSVLILTVIMGLGVLDLLDDYKDGSDLEHLLIESLLVVTCAELIRRVWVRYRKQETEIVRLTESKIKLGKSLEKWKNDTRKTRGLIRNSIEKQFEEWGLSRSEMEVAFLTLRGFRFEQIAGLLNKSERTVRKQAGSIYEKSGFTDRASFVGFFLESIFELGDETSFHD